MDVILTKEVPHLGNIGSLVSVKSGYARNFLFPQKLAVPKTKTSLAISHRQQEEIQKEIEAKKAVYIEMLAAIQKIKSLEIKVKSGPDEKLFGTVTTQHIANELKKQKGLEIDKKHIVLKEPIKHLGIFTAHIELSKEHRGELLLKVLSEDH